MKSGNGYRRKLCSAACITVLLLVYGTSISVFSGCASTKESESTGQYMDDAAITGKVKAAFLNDTALKSGQISVETYKGVVQLSGFVDSQDQVRKAGDLAAAVPGVVSVRNDLIVKR